MASTVATSHVFDNFETLCVQVHGHPITIDGMHVKQYVAAVISRIPHMLPVLFLMCNRLKDVGASRDLTRSILDTMPGKFLMGAYLTLRASLFPFLTLEKALGQRNG